VSQLTERINPLLSLEHEHHPLPLADVQPGDYLPALDAALERARKNIHAIPAQDAPPTFENTLLTLEAADEWADRISSLFFHLLNTDGTDELQKLVREIPPRLSAFRNDVILNPDLFARIEALYARRAELLLDEEQSTVLENHVQSFRRNGAGLSEEDQQTLRKLDEELSTCSPSFAEHVLKATQAFSLWVEDEKVVEPMPASAVATAKAAAKAEDRPDAWKFTLDAPSYIAFMTYAPHAGLREKMWRAYGERCVEGEFSNQELIRRILELRYQRAQLLGYDDHVHYTLERRMAGDLGSLEAFYDRMRPAVLPAAKRDLDEVRAFKEQETGDPVLHPWDYAYYSERLKKAAYELDQEEIRPWFEFESTLGAAFTLGRKLFDLTFIPVDDLPVNHPEVRTFRVEEASDGREIGTLYIDPFPRSTKKPGAWMVPLLGQGVWNHENKRPAVGVVCNFTPPVDGAPSLLTLDEARTLFHEFGHALHELLSTCTCRSVAGTSVYWDFVELPSQLMENWLGEADFLREHALHVETGEPLPEVFIERIQAARTFQKGYQAARQLSFGILDLTWYRTPPDQVGEDLIAFERSAMEEFRLFEPEPGVAMSPSFQHIFSGGYASGYYSYKWAEVLEADVFACFLEEGLFDPTTAHRLREEILSKGGSRHPMDLFKAFRGREPDPDALLKRDGMLV